MRCNSFALTSRQLAVTRILVVVKPRAVAPHRIVLPDRDQFYALDEGQAGRNADRLHVVVNLGQGNRTALAVPMGDGGTHRRDRAPINVAHGPHEASRCAGDKHQYLCRAGDISRHIRRNLHIGTSRCHLAALAYFVQRMSLATVYARASSLRSMRIRILHGTFPVLNGRTHTNQHC